nr:MAG TPA: hypothetical protein [Caudoviricetes sp.]
MKLNPQAIINAGSVGGGTGSGGGIQVGTNVPCGIQNNHRFENEQERDAYFATKFAELDRLKTIIVCGGKLQLWTGKTALSPYENTHWVDMTWVIQGEQGTAGEKGENGRGIAAMKANISDNDHEWTLEITYTDGTEEMLVFPVPDVLANVAQRLSALETNWTAPGTWIHSLDVHIVQGRFPVNEATQQKPPMMAGKGSVDVYKVGDNDVVQVVRSIDGGVYTRSRQSGQWSQWVSSEGGGGSGGGLTGDQEAMLISLGTRLPEMSPETRDLNTLQKQGRFCFDSHTANRPQGANHGSVDVHACKDHVLQIATSLDGVMFHRALEKANGRWSEWLQVSDNTGGATIYAFPRVSCAYTTAKSLRMEPGRHSFYIPWKYVIHDNYGCTPRTNVQDAEEWWVCPKSGSYDMEVYIDVSFVKTQQTLPPMIVLEAYHRSQDGQERELARYNMPLDLSQKNQKTKSAKLQLLQFASGDMIRWRVSAAGASWSEDDNPDVSFVPFRTMLMVDEAEFDTAKRIGRLAYNTWANFQAQKGYAATAGAADGGKARLNAVKWLATVEEVTAEPNQP